MFPNISLGSMPRSKIIIKLADIQQLYIIFKQTEKGNFSQRNDNILTKHKYPN